MGLADRDYQQAPPPRGGMMSRLTPVVKLILLINVVVFILDYLVLAPAMGYPPILYFGAFSISSAIHEFRIWEFLTFQFIHGGFMHILFNSIALYFFGPWMERQLGSKLFIRFYLLCGAAGAVFYTLLHYLGFLAGPADVPLVGASAGIYGIFAGVAVIAPNLRVQLLFPPIELTMRQLAIALLGIATVVIFFNLNNAGGEAGHLGGAILGYLLMRKLHWLGRASPITIHRRKSFRQRWESKLSPRTKIRFEDNNDVDRILDKISREGFQSLTDEEKEVLKRAAEKGNP